MFNSKNREVRKIFIKYLNKIMSGMIIRVAIARILDIILCRLSILLILGFEPSKSVVKRLNCLTLPTDVMRNVRIGTHKTAWKIGEKQSAKISRTEFSDPDPVVTPMGFSRDNCSVYNAFCLVITSRVQIDCVRNNKFHALIATVECLQIMYSRSTPAPSWIDQCNCVSRI